MRFERHTHFEPEGPAWHGVDEGEGERDAAMIEWEARRERLHAKQVGRMHEAEVKRGRSGSGSGGSGDVGGGQARVGRKAQGGCGLRVDDAVEMMKMEVDVERLASREAHVEAMARARRRALKVMVTLDLDLGIVVEGERAREVVPAVKAKSKAKGKDKKKAKGKAAKKKTTKKRKALAN